MATCYISAINLKFADMVNLICVANATFELLNVLFNVLFMSFNVLFNILNVQLLSFITFYFFYQFSLCVIYNIMLCERSEWSEIAYNISDEQLGVGTFKRLIWGL